MKRRGGFKLVPMNSEADLKWIGFYLFNQSFGGNPFECMCVWQWQGPLRLWDQPFTNGPFPDTQLTRKPKPSGKLNSSFKMEGKVVRP